MDRLYALYETAGSDRRVWLLHLRRIDLLVHLRNSCQPVSLEVGAIRALWHWPYASAGGSQARRIVPTTIEETALDSPDGFNAYHAALLNGMLTRKVFHHDTYDYPFLFMLIPKCIDITVESTYKRLHFCFYINIFLINCLKLTR